MLTDCLKDKVVIKIADRNDLCEIFELIDGYADVEIDRDIAATKKALQMIVDLQGCLVGTINDEIFGGVAGYCMPSLFNSDVFFVVMFLYIKKEFRHFTKNFIKELELVMTPTKCTKIVFGIPRGDNQLLLQRFFSMIGYQQLEIHMVKSL